MDALSFFLGHTTEELFGDGLTGKETEGSAVMPDELVGEEEEEKKEEDGAGEAENFGNVAEIAAEWTASRGDGSGEFSPANTTESRRFRLEAPAFRSAEGDGRTGVGVEAVERSCGTLSCSISADDTGDVE